MEYREHKHHNLQSAINDLPNYEAPNAWHRIERNLPLRRQKYWLLLFLIPIGIACFTLLTDKPDSGLEITKLEISQKLEKDHISNQEEIAQIFSEANQIDNTNNENDNRFTPIILPTLKSNPVLETEYLPQETLPVMIADTQTIYHEIGENLVPNPSFEDFNICPKDFNKKASKRFIPDWKMASKGTPDYFNSCSKDNVGIPNNFAGSAYPRTGNGYVGLITRQNFTKDNKITGKKPIDYREYIQAKLNEPLIANQEYKVSFWVHLGSSSRFGTDAIGSLVSTEAVYMRSKGVLYYFPQVENGRGSILDNQNYWVKIEGIITATGGEEYITIGNFRNNGSTYFRMINETEFNYSYYYIDDVSVTKIRTEKQIVYRNINNKDSDFIEKDLSMTE